MMCDSELISSKREARRLIEQGAVTVDGERITSITEEIPLETPVVLKVGKRRFLRITS
jgi:tyrosyl-tRNA synthetase